MSVFAGMVTLRAWRALPKGVRREALSFAREGRPHPDPVVAQAGLAAARWAQRWHNVILIACFAVFAIVQIASRFAVPSPEDWLLRIVGLLATGALLTVSFGGWGLSPRQTALLYAAGVRGEVGLSPVGPPRRLTVVAATAPWRARLMLGALFAVALVAMFGDGPGAWWQRLSWVACLGVTILLAVLIAERIHQPRWARRRPRAGQPVVVLGQLSIALPHLDFIVPWSGVVSVDLGGERELALMVYPSDPAAAVGVPVAWLSVPPEVVVAAARDHLVAARAEVVDP